MSARYVGEWVHGKNGSAAGRKIVNPKFVYFSIWWIYSNATLSYDYCSGPDVPPTLEAFAKFKATKNNGQTQARPGLREFFVLPKESKFILTPHDVALKFAGEHLGTANKKEITVETRSGRKKVRRGCTYGPRHVKFELVSTPENYFKTLRFFLKSHMLIYMPISP